MHGAGSVQKGCFMPISVKCTCGAGFKAQDHLAGKRVKCPKCANAITIPAAKPDVANPPAGTQANANPLMDLLDEAGVKATSTGPTCPACNSEMDPSAVICVSCGYNMATGEYLETYVEVEDKKSFETDKMTTAEKIMAKAEAEIEHTPETAVGEDFGDGSDSFIIALGAMAVMALLVLVGVVIVLSADTFADSVGMAYITFVGLVLTYSAARIWLVVFGFMESIEHGLILLVTFCLPLGDIYALFYGYSRGRWIASTIILVMSLLSSLLLSLVSYGVLETG